MAFLGSFRVSLACMLIPVGNMNDKSRNQAQIQVVPNRGTGIQHPAPPPWRERDEAGGGGGGEEGSVGAVLLRGLVFTLLNIRKTSSKDRCRSLAMCLWVWVCFHSGGGSVYRVDGWQGLPRNCQLQAHQVQVLQKPPAPPASLLSWLCPVFLAKSNKKPCKKGQIYTR